MLTLLTTLLLVPPPATQATDSLVRTRSSHPVTETVTRLRTAAESRGLTIFAVVDHAANARQADLDLPPTTLVILGNPRAGTLLMHCDPAVAVDLPLRLLVWQDTEGRTWIGHQPVSLLRARYRLDACGEVLQRIEGVLEALHREAAGAGGGDW